MRRYLGRILLLLLALSALYGWVRWSGMPDFAWGRGLFGHLEHSKNIRKAWAEKRLPDFVFDSAQTRELIGFMKSSGTPVSDWLFLVGPHAHHYIERADHVADDFSPATGFVLSLFPERRSISWLVRLTLLALLAFGANAVVIRAIAPSTPDKAPGALVAAMWPALAAFQAILVLARSELGNPSMYAVVLPTFVAAFLTAFCWSRGNRGRESRWAAFAAGAACGFAAFIRIPGALQIPGFLVLLKKRDWFWFLAGGYFFGLLPLAFYQASAAGAWWATTYGPIDTVGPSLNAIPRFLSFYLTDGVGSRYFLVPFLAFAAYFGLRSWKHWKRLGLAVLVSWALPAAYFLTHVPAVSYYLNPAHLAAVGLLGWGIFFEYEEPMPEFHLGQEVVKNWKTYARFAPAVIMLLFATPWAWALLSNSGVALEPPLDESLFKVERIPAELLLPDSWVWSDVSSGAFWYYGDKPAFNIASGGSTELRRKIFAWAASHRGDQFLIMDGGASKLVADELERSGAMLAPRGEVFGQKYFKISLGR